MNQKDSLKQQKAWYCEPWVWLLITLPASAVLGGIVTILIAMESDDGLVVDDYYKQGLEINKKLDRDKAANKYNLVANLQLTDDLKDIQVSLDANNQFVSPDSIKLSFLHPTKKGQDQILILYTVDKRTYTGSLPPLIQGDWYIQIEAADWRLLEQLYIGI